MVMTDYKVHESHCFRVDEYENEFMGCKYGRDENCPVRKPYPLTREDLMGANEVLSRYTEASKKSSKEVSLDGLLDFMDKEIKKLEKA